MSQGNLEGLLNCSLEKLKGLVDVNTIIGQPITAPDGTIIVPVSKVAFGYGSGGSDFGGDKPKDMFGGGSGAGRFYSAFGFSGDPGGKCKAAANAEL